MHREIEEKLCKYTHSFASFQNIYLNQSHLKLVINIFIQKL